MSNATNDLTQKSKKFTMLRLKKDKNMQFNIPRNFKEEVICAIPNCAIMAMGMMTINLWIFNSLTAEKWIITLPFIYMTAFVLDFFFVGKFTTWIANKYNIQKFQPLYRVLLMAGILTFVAPIVESFGENIVNLTQYSHAFPRNYIMALFLQVLIAMPLGNYVLGKYQKSKIVIK